MTSPQGAVPDARRSGAGANDGTGVGADADADAGDGAEQTRAPATEPGAARRRRRPRWQPAAVGLLAVLVLAALFLAGTRLPGILNPPAALPAPATATPSATPNPVPTSTAGRQLAGTFEWNRLRGGECISPYVSAWQQRFTVVDCDRPHGAQVMSTGSLGADAALVYPGQSAIAERLNLLCQRPENFDQAILGAYPDVVWQASYPVDDAQWQAGQRSYYCFVSRSSSGALLGDFAPPAFSG